MENLSIKHNTHIIIRRVVGVTMFVCGVIYFIISIGTPKVLNIILAIFWTLLGIAYFIPALTPGESSVTIGEGYIIVKWLNWIRSKIIQDSEIDKITVTKFHILIDRKNFKQVKLPVDFFELDQKREVYTYFIELSKQKNYPLEKIGFGQE
jgi:hypothetical protein